MSKYTFAEEAQAEPPLFELYGDDPTPWTFNHTVYTPQCPRCGNDTLGFNTRTASMAHVHNSEGPGGSAGFVSIAFHCHGCQQNSNLEIGENSGTVTLRWHEARP